MYAMWTPGTPWGIPLWQEAGKVGLFHVRRRYSMGAGSFEVPGGTYCEVVGHSQGMFRCSPNISVCNGFCLHTNLILTQVGPHQEPQVCPRWKDPSCCCTEVNEAHAQMDPR